MCFELSNIFLIAESSDGVWIVRSSRRDTFVRSSNSVRTSESVDPTPTSLPIATVLFHYA